MHVPEHLTHLRRDRRGLPVPYVNRWGLEEDAERIRIRHDGYVGMDAVFYDETGLDEPNFRAQEFGRQRECMVRGLCQVCARPVPWSRRRLVIGAVSVQTIRFDGREVPVVTEPWLCQRCAEFAVAVCPALIRRHREEQLRIIEVTAKWQARLITSYGTVEGPLAEQSQARPPAMWTKLALLHVQLTMVDPADPADPAAPDEAPGQPQTVAAVGAP